MKKDKVVYFLGAGASAHALPVLDKLREEILETGRSLNSYFANDTNLPSFLKTLEQAKDDLVTDLNWLVHESRNHQTIDTLAKKYFLIKDTTSLWRLKRTLITYFHIAQLFIRAGSLFKRDLTLDKRYDSLIATIAENNERSEVQLNPRYGIVSWNYDIQFELSLRQYVKEPINKIKKEFQIHPVKGQLDLENYNCDIQQFAMFKLNGNALWDSKLGIINEPIPSEVDTILMESDKYRAMEAVLKYYSNKEIDDQWYFQFSWEDGSVGLQHSSNSQMIEDAKQLISRAQTLIIVGYSFPAFNRHLDKELLSVFSGNKIIIQDANPQLIEDNLKDLSSVFAGPFHNENPKKYFVHDPVNIEEGAKYFPFN